MLYENYQNKIQKIAAFLSKVLKHIVLIGAIAGAVVVTTVTLLATKGIPGKVKCAPSVVYGDAISCSANAFLSPVRYEYRSCDGGEWSEDAPKLPGEYEVRAVGKSSGNKDRYGKASGFIIEPLHIDVFTDDKSIVFGDVPSVSHSELAYSDKLVCSDFLYDDVTLESTTATPDHNAIQILDKIGNDVTVGYKINVISSEISFRKRPLTVVTQSSSSVYDGKPFVFDQYQVSGNTSVGRGDVISAKFYPITDAGEMYNSADIVIYHEAQGNIIDVTHQYDISVVEGKLTVELRPIVISTGSLTATYNNQDVSCPEFEIESDGLGLAEGHSISVVSTQTQKNSGKYSNDMTFAITDKDGKDVTGNYSFLINAGVIDIRPVKIKIETDSTSIVYDGEKHSHSLFSHDGDLVKGHDFMVVSAPQITDVGKIENKLEIKIYDFNGYDFATNTTPADVTANYDIEYVYGTVTVTPRPIKIISGGGQYTYGMIQGLPYGYYKMEGEVADGQVVLIDRVNGEQGNYTWLEVGKYVNEITVSVYIQRQGRDVSKNYDITYEYGEIEILPRKITLYTGDLNYIYDGYEHACTDYYSIPASFGLLEGHVINVKHSTAPLNVGKYQNVYSDYTIETIGGIDVTRNYEITWQYGEIEVFKRPITIKTGDLSVIYDGEKHDCMRYEIWSEFGFADGDELVIKSAPMLIDAGSVSNKFSEYQIIKDGKTDVTSNYEITWEYGTLEVRPRPISIAPQYAEKVYDGIALRAGNAILCDDSPFGLVKGHTLQAPTVGERTDVGETQSSVSNKVRIMNGQVDVTRNYVITRFTNKIVILPRPITVYTMGAEKYYDGTPLRNPNYSYSNDLVSGHQLILSTNGIQTEIGESENTYSYLRITAGGRDVTHNYDITNELGTLHVKPYAIVNVYSYSASKKYDGTPLTCPKYEIVIEDGELSDEYELKVNVYGSITECGVVENSLSVRLTDKYGRDMSRFYTINAVPGFLEVYHDEIQFFGRIKTDRDGYIYLKMTSYGDFDGQYWRGAVPYNKTLPGGLSYDYLTSYALLNNGGNINFAEFKDMQAYMLPYYLGFDGNYSKPSSDTVYASYMSDYMMSYYSIPHNYNGFDYLKGNLGEYAKYEEEYRKFVYNQYTKIDGETLEYMKGIIAKQGFDPNDPGVILKAARYIQNAARYTLEYDPALDFERNVAIAFLEEYKEGKCTHYASAGTLLFRALGFPARYVTGFMIETHKDVFVDIMSPGHAWVEVYIDGVGWIQVEVTGASDGSEDMKQVIEISPTYTYKNYDGKYLYPKQEVEANGVLSELLDKGYTYHVEISGSQLKVGSSASTIESFILYDSQGNDVTDQFIIRCEDGVLRVIPEGDFVIRVYLYQLQKYYDGTPLRYEDSDYEVIEIPEGVDIKLVMNIELTEVGHLTLTDINENLAKYVSCSVYKNGKKINSGYTLIFDVFDSTDPSYVPIVISPRYIELTSATQSKQADDKPLMNDQVYISYGSLVNGHSLTALAMGYIDSVGSAENEIDIMSINIVDRNGNSVLHNYSIGLVNGELTITDPED